MRPAVANYASVVADSAATLAHGNELVLEPWIEGGEISPARVAFRWLRPVHHVEFTFRVPEHALGHRLAAGVRVFVGVLILADIRFAVNVQADAGAAPGPAATARPYRQVFASYSRDDTAIVERVRAAAAALGDRYIVDVDALLPGQPWEETIGALITRSDIFQLFWSRNAMRSEPVRREWEHALAQRRNGFVRPVYWEDPFPTAGNLPPADLAKLHFWRLAPAVSRPPPASTVPPAWSSPPPPPAPRPGHSRWWSMPPADSPPVSSSSRQPDARWSTEPAAFSPPPAAPPRRASTFRWVLLLVLAAVLMAILLYVLLR